MPKYAKVLPSNNGWTHTDFIANKVTNPQNTAIHIPNTQICWGFEEWNFNEKLNEITLNGGYKFGYLECYRGNGFNDIKDIHIFFRETINPNNNIEFGCFKEVKQIDNQDIAEIRKVLDQINWLKEVQNHFNDYPNEFDIYLKGFNINHITGNLKPSFPFNIKYRAYEPIENNIVDIKMKRLSIRYN